MIRKTLAILAMGLYLAGCNTVAGLGEDVSAGGKKLERTAEKAKQ
ncbi:MAG: entericidin A/B family lipoprotein [Burkholderiaceae bacterium]